MTRLTVVLALWLLPSVAVAGAFTVTTTAEQDAAIANVVASINASRAASTPPVRDLLTAQAYVQSVLAAQADQWVQQQRQAVLPQALKAFASLPSDQKASVCALLGLAPCPP